MSITTYAELQTAVGTWLHRSDLSAVAPDFVTLCEAKVNRVLRIKTMESRVTAILDELYEDVPTDFLEMRKLKITTAPSSELTYLTPATMDARYPDLDAGRPLHYTFLSGQLKFERTPDQAYTMEMDYYKRIPALSNSATTNWLLTNHPDAYLYGSLAEAEPYMKNDIRIAVWKQLYQNAIDQIMGADQRERWGGSILQVTPDITPV